MSAEALKAAAGAWKDDPELKQGSVRKLRQETERRFKRVTARSLSNAHRAELETLSEEFDRLLGRMQTPAARASMNAAFHATPKALGKAAVAVARKRA